MPAFDVVQRWKGRVAVAGDGGSLGTVVEIFYDAETDQPGWALLATGTGERLVPVMHAVEDGVVVRVPVPAALVETSPGMDHGARLWPQEEAALYAHYGLAWSGGQASEDDEPGLAQVEYLNLVRPAI
jgi:hypothetical protein